jgi:hypothetical protein
MGSDNYFADALSRNPVGLCQESRDIAMKPRGLFVAKVEVGADSTLMRELGNLSGHQRGDPAIMRLREKLEGNLQEIQGKYMIRDDTLYSRNDRTDPYWRIMLPKRLENPVIRYVHTLSGYQGTDKCVAQIAHSFHLKSLEIRC